jgi:hypothetical protein
MVYRKVSRRKASGKTHALVRSVTTTVERPKDSLAPGAANRDAGPTPELKSSTTRTNLAFGLSWIPKTLRLLGNPEQPQPAS